MLFPSELLVRGGGWDTRLDTLIGMAVHCAQICAFLALSQSQVCHTWMDIPQKIESLPKEWRVQYALMILTLFILLQMALIKVGAEHTHWTLVNCGHRLTLTPLLGRVMRPCSR